MNIDIMSTTEIIFITSILTLLGVVVLGWIGYTIENIRMRKFVSSVKNSKRKLPDHETSQALKNLEFLLQHPDLWSLTPFYHNKVLDNPDSSDSSDDLVNLNDVKFELEYRDNKDNKDDQESESVTLSVAKHSGTRNQEPEIRLSSE